MKRNPHSTPRMECRHCGCRMNEITHTWINEVNYFGKKRTIIKRRRVCRHCRLPFTTVETYENEEYTNLPEDVLPFRPVEEPVEESGVNKPAIPKINIVAAGDSTPGDMLRAKRPSSPREKRPRKNK